jgi:hypothetical protein
MTARLLSALGVACLAVLGSGLARAEGETALGPEGWHQTEAAQLNPFEEMPPELRTFSLAAIDDRAEAERESAELGGGSPDAALASSETRLATANSQAKASRSTTDTQIAFGPTDGGYSITIQMPAASAATVESRGRELLLAFPHALPQFNAPALQESAAGLLEGVSVGFDTMLLLLAPGVTVHRADVDGSLRLLLQRSATSAETSSESSGVVPPGSNQASSSETGVESRSAGPGSQLEPGDQGERRLRLLDAQLLAQTGQVADARRRFEALIPEMPTSPEPLEGLAGVAQRTGRWRQALALYQDALRVDPGELSAAAAVAAIERAQASRVRTDLEYRQTEGGVGTGRAEAIINQVSGHQLFGDGWRVGFSLDLAQVHASQVQNPNGTISSFSGDRWRAELSLQHDGLDGNIFAGSLFLTNSTPGFGLRGELPDDYGTTLLRAEYRRPNWDFFQSLIDNGTRDRLAVGRRHQILPNLTGRLELGANQYGIPGDGNVARTITVTGELRLGNLAGVRGLSAAYVLDAEYVLELEKRVGPLDQTYAPLDILDREVHALTVGYAGARGTSAAEGIFTYEFSGGYGIDRYGRSGPLFSGVLGYALGSFEARLRASYVQNIGRSRGTSSIYAASLTWLF